MARYWKDMIEQVVAGAAPAEVVAEGGMGGSSTIIDKPRLRLVSKHAGEGGHTAKVYKDLDYNEYRVKSYDPNGKHTGEAGDSFHDDLDDAQGTAKLYLKLIHARSQKSSK
jgi:hypothetical protein